MSFKTEKGEIMRMDSQYLEYQELTASQSFYLFIENVVKPFYDSSTIKWQSFRDDELWCHDIQLIYTLNE